MPPEVQRVIRLALSSQQAGFLTGNVLQASEAPQEHTDETGTKGYA